MSHLSGVGGSKTVNVDKKQVFFNLSCTSAYVTQEDVGRLGVFQEQTVIVVKAPEETKLEVPAPKEVKLQKTETFLFCSYLRRYT